MPERPTDAEIDTAIEALRGHAFAAGCQGSSEEPWEAAIACIEWASGRSKTVSVPFYLDRTIGD